MSTDPSIIFYQGLRCTKVRREPRATDPVTDTPSTTLTDITSPTETSTEDSRVDRTSSGGYTTSTASQTLDHQSGLDGIHSTTLTHSALTTSTSATSTSEPTSLISSVPDDDSSGPPYALIFGLLFGILGLIALIALIIIIIHRRRRSNQVSNTDSLQGDRASANSRTGLRRDFRSQMSYLGDASPTSSGLFNFQPGAAHHSDKQHQTPPYSDPFSDTEAVSDGRIRTAPTNKDYEDRPYIHSTEPQAANRDSFHSGTSLGSTLVLPGRSSMGSEYQGTNLPSPTSAPSGTSMGSTLILPGRSSTGSDSQGPKLLFPKPLNSSSYTYQRTVVRIDGVGSLDPDKSQTVVSRRSSGTMPAGLL
ncbi:uncharacterized protein BDW70DRAFT_134714 [Aspergillus foveolatus]|uniref:uncharacterized protein n=1 Tax=Aspergillus foveolatus TaxID=210207 RepID=UPI003CCDC1AC